MFSTARFRFEIRGFEPLGRADVHPLAIVQFATDESFPRGGTQQRLVLVLPVNVDQETGRFLQVFCRDLEPVDEAL